jgi:hypothetical protein
LDAGEQRIAGEVLAKRLAPRQWRQFFAEIRRDLVTIQAKIVIGSLCALSEQRLGRLDLLP